MISIEGHIRNQFLEASTKLGVDLDTLTMMAISGFLNSPLVSGDKHQEISSDDLVLSHESENDDTDVADPNESSPKENIFVEDGDAKEYPTAFEGLSLDDISFRLDEITAVDISSMDEDTVLWGQFSRFLPIKTSLRILALCSDMRKPVLITHWFEACYEWAHLIRGNLRQRDKDNRTPRGEQLASGFPKSNGNSLNRYVNHFCASFYRDGTVIGFPAHLGLIHVEGEGEFEDRVVSLTQDGLDYVRMRNPVIDEDSPSKSMSSEEAQFMMDRIEEGLPASWGFLKFVLSSVAEGADTPNELSAEIARLYGKGTTRNWNKKQVPTYRTGAIGLLGDMGLISRTWNFRSVTYSVTDKGREVLKQ
tara:strand:+ start:456 stop:1544 length:1089 start_codon:yes stop_codon:yes gene_type:complete